MQPLMEYNFTEHIFNTDHTCISIETDLEILRVLPEGGTLNKAEQIKINKYVAYSSQGNHNGRLDSYN